MIVKILTKRNSENRTRRNKFNNRLCTSHLQTNISSINLPVLGILSGYERVRCGINLLTHNLFPQLKPVNKIVRNLHCFLLWSQIVGLNDVCKNMVTSRKFTFWSSVSVVRMLVVEVLLLRRQYW